MYVTGTCIFVSSFRMQLPYPTRSAEPDTPSARPRISLSRLQIPVRTGSKITDMSHDMEGGMSGGDVCARGRRNTKTPRKEHRDDGFFRFLLPDHGTGPRVPCVSRVCPGSPRCLFTGPPGVFLPYRYRNRYRYARKSSESLSSSECFHSPLVWPRGLPRCASRRELPFSFLW